MISQLQNMNERERLMVITAAICLVIYLFYLLVYSPLTGAVVYKTNQLTEKTGTLNWMKSVSQEVVQQYTPEEISNTKLLTVIAAQLNQQSLKSFPYQLQQTGSGDIQITFEQVPYNLIMKWLWKLTTDYAVMLKQTNIDHTDIPGIVKLSVVFSAG